jgi:hypothetical protein
MWCGGGDGGAVQPPSEGPSHEAPKRIHARFPLAGMMREEGGVRAFIGRIRQARARVVE